MSLPISTFSPPMYSFVMATTTKFRHSFCESSSSETLMMFPGRLMKREFSTTSNSVMLIETFILPDMQKNARKPSKRHGWLRMSRHLSYLRLMTQKSSPMLRQSDTENSWRNLARSRVCVLSSVMFLSNWSVRTGLRGRCPCIFPA